MEVAHKPPTLQASRFHEWLRIHVLSRYINNLPREEKTLDLACGWGFSFRINPNFWGVELDDACVAYCQAQGYKVVKGSLLEPLPFEDDFFDNVFTQDVLEHFEFGEADQIFRNVHRVLRTGGQFMNVIPNYKGYGYGFVIDAGHKHFMIPQQISEIAERNGFRFVRAYSVPVPGIMNSWFTHAKYVTICERL